MIKQIGIVVGFTTASAVFAGPPSALNSIRGQEVLNFDQSSGIVLINDHDNPSSHMLPSESTYGDSASETPVYPSDEMKERDNHHN